MVVCACDPGYLGMEMSESQELTGQPFQSKQVKPASGSVRDTVSGNKQKEKTYIHNNNTGIVLATEKPW